MQRKLNERETKLARRTPRRRWLAALVCALMMAGSTPLFADDYDPREGGHPLRIIAYVLHPVGVALDYLILRPAHWLGSQEPFKTVFGHED